MQVLTETGHAIVFGMRGRSGNRLGGEGKRTQCTLWHAYALKRCWGAASDADHRRFERAE